MARGIRGGAVVAICLWLYLIWLPVSNNKTLLVVFAGIGLLALLGGGGWPFNRSRLDPRIVSLLLVQAAFGVYGCAVGFIDHTPGLATQTVLYLVTPALYWLCVNATTRPILAAIVKTGGWATAALATIIIIYQLQSKGHVPHVLPQKLLDAQQTFAANEKLKFIGLESLLILGPLYTSSLFFGHAPRWFPRTSVRVYAAIATLVVMVMSGRQAFILVEIALPFIAALVARSFRIHRTVNTSMLTTAIRPYRGRAIPVAFFAVMLALAAGIGGVLPTKTVGKAATGVTHLVTGGGSSNVPDAGNVLTLDQASLDTLSSAEILRSEYPALYHGWAHSPITGAGFGAVLPGYARNLAKPWNFEAQYGLLLFQTGLIGVLLLLVLAWKGWHILRDAALAADPELRLVLVATTTAVIGVLIANTVDPYLQAPAINWGMYLPFAAANLALTGRRQQAQTARRVPSLPEMGRTVRRRSPAGLSSVDVEWIRKERERTIASREQG